MDTCEAMVGKEQQQPRSPPPPSDAFPPQGRKSATKVMRCPSTCVFTLVFPAWKPPLAVVVRALRGVLAVWQDAKCLPATRAAMAQYCFPSELSLRAAELASVPFRTRPQPLPAFKAPPPLRLRPFSLPSNRYAPMYPHNR